MDLMTTLNRLSKKAFIGASVFSALMLFIEQDALSQSIIAEQDAILHGQSLAKENCARCHSTSLTGESPNSNAPPFRTFSSYRSTELISWMLIDKTTPKHSQMPHFKITTKQALDIVAWINWLQPEAHGKRLVEKNCSTCHAVTLNDESAHPAAPPFRNISMFYPVDALEEAFAEGIETGHPDMPVFDVSITQLHDIIAYIKTLQ